MSYKWRINVKLKSGDKICGIWNSNKMNDADLIGEIFPHNFANLSFLRLSNSLRDKTYLIKIEEIEYIEILLPEE